MKKILSTIIAVFIVCNTVFAVNVLSYNVNSNLADVKIITVESAPVLDLNMEYTSIDLTTNVMFTYRDVTVDYNSPYMGDVIFSGRLVNSEKLFPDVVYIVRVNVKPGRNIISRFYKLPVGCNIIGYEGWNNFYDIITVDQVTPTNAVFMGYIN